MADAERIRQVMTRYPELLTKGDVDAIVDLYHPDATLEDPIGTERRRGAAAIREFYAASAGSVLMKLTGPVRAAAGEGAAPYRVLLGPEGRQQVIDIIDVMTFDADGAITSMRAFWSADAIRPATPED